MSDKIIAFPNKLKQKETTAQKQLLKKYATIVTSLLKKASFKELKHIKQTDSLMVLFLENFGSEKTSKLISILKSYIYLYWENITIKHDHYFLSQYFNNLKELTPEKISELLEVSYLLQVNDVENMEVLSRVSRRLSGNESIFNAYNIQDNYIKQILKKRPFFNLEDKVKSVQNACKINDGANVIKFENVFFNAEKNGNINKHANSGSGESRSLGLFVDDMQFVDEYVLNFFDSKKNSLKSEFKLKKNKGYMSYDKNVYENKMQVLRKRIISKGFCELIRAKNTCNETIEGSLKISCNIRDIFEVRSKIAEGRRQIESNTYSDEIEIICKFGSGRSYSLKVKAIESQKTLKFEFLNDNTIELKFSISPKSEKRIELFILPSLINPQKAKKNKNKILDIEHIQKKLDNKSESAFPKIKIKGQVAGMQKTIDRCLSDLNMLINHFEYEDKNYKYVSAGLPRYSALFGRDSLICAMQLLPIAPDIAKDTLELLALFQGKSFQDKHKNEIEQIMSSDWDYALKRASLKGLKDFYNQREEQEGKILHELRVGEFAYSGTIPHSPYYGTVDATPLWLILFADYCLSMNNLNFCKSLLPVAEQALKWIENNIQHGYLRFIGSSSSKIKIKNQGWKDAGDSIRHVISPLGKLTDPSYPIALAEVQGYVYRAYSSMSNLYYALGEKHLASNLKNKAARLKESFNKDFWLDRCEYFSMALDSKNQAVETITSNIGHCLAMGIINEEKHKFVEKRLMSDEMFTGWGIRTLNCSSPAFDALSYHNGSVWVHDTAFSALGLSLDSKSKIAKALFETASMFDDNRLPELFGGFKRKFSDRTIQIYPEACSPQGWASGSLLWLLLNIISYTKDSRGFIFKQNTFPEWIETFEIS